MPIKVQCPNADRGKVAMVKDQLAGKRAKCGCGTIVIIPYGSAYRPQPAAGAVAPARRPAGHAPKSGMVTAIAVVNFVLAGLSLLSGLLFFLVGGLFAGAGRVHGDFERLAAQEFGRQGFDFPGSGVGGSLAFLGTLMMILSVAALAWGAAAIPSGIGLLMRRNWGRVLALILAAVAGLMGLAGLLPIFLGGGFSTVMYLVFYGGYAAWVFLVLLRARVRSEFA